MLTVVQGSSLGSGAAEFLLDLWVIDPDTGRLADPHSIQYQLWDMAGDAPAQITAGWEDATKVSTGRYCVTEDIAADATTGRWQARWQWTVVEDGAQYQVRRDFEVASVLWEDPASWLCLPYEVRAEGFDTDDISDERLHGLLSRVAQHIRSVTGRQRFGPVGLEMEVRGSGTDLLVVSDPIIGLESVQEGLISGGVRDSDDYDLDEVEVLNRHLRAQGAGERDDRVLPGLLTSGGTWPTGYLYWLSGVFGYTDPDVGIPGPGHLPLPLRRAAVLLAIRQSSPQKFFDDVEDRTTRHLVQSDRMGSHGTAFFRGRAGAITGDAEIDDLLLEYVRPPRGIVV